MEHRLEMRHTDCVSPFELPFIDRYNSAADNLRHIRARVYGHDKQSREYYVKRFTVVKQRKSPEYYHCLNHHRRAAENLYVRV